MKCAVDSITDFSLMNTGRRKRRTADVPYGYHQKRQRTPVYYHRSEQQQLENVSFSFPEKERAENHKD